jgi:hypothetical protein
MLHVSQRNSPLQRKLSSLKIIRSKISTSTGNNRGKRNMSRSRQRNCLARIHLMNFFNDTKRKKLIKKVIENIHQKNQKNRNKTNSAKMLFQLI